MDNLTHSLTGLAIARCFPTARWGRWVAPVGILAANLPDIEIIAVNPGDKAYYLVEHRGWSHSLLGVGLEVLAFVGVVLAISALLSRYTQRDLRPRAGPLFLLITVEAYLHVFLDFWNTYGVRPFYPFDPTWYYGDILFVIDPWLWLILGAAMVLGSGTRPGGSCRDPRHAGGIGDQSRGTARHHPDGNSNCVDAVGCHRDSCRHAHLGTNFHSQIGNDRCCGCSVLCKRRFSSRAHQCVPCPNRLCGNRQ